MNPSEFFAREDERRAATSRATRSTYGMDVKPFSQAEAEEYLKDSVACPRCGAPISIKGGHQQQAEHCRHCAQILSRGRSGKLRGTQRYMQAPEPKPDTEIEAAIKAYAIRKKRGK
jgi:ribosomal protein L40E